MSEPEIKLDERDYGEGGSLRVFSHGSGNTPTTLIDKAGFGKYPKDQVIVYISRRAGIGWNDIAKAMSKSRRTVIRRFNAINNKIKKGKPMK